MITRYVFQRRGGLDSYIEPEDKISLNKKYGFYSDYISISFVRKDNRE